MRRHRSVLPAGVGAGLAAMATALLLAVCGPAADAATYYVDGGAAKASDTNPGTRAKPWKTISRAGSAKELKPGDTVLIASGVYREHVKIVVSGEPGKPIAFAAAPGARVVIKASEIVKGTWTKASRDPATKEPFPNAFTDVWKIPLGDEYFTDPDFPGAYSDRSRRWISQVVLDDDEALQLIGPDPIYKNTDYSKLRLVGHGVGDMIDGSFYFDDANQTLYIRHAGDPAWSDIEVGVRGWALTADGVHDVVVRGLEMRLNRQPGGQWPMVSFSHCRRVLVDRCRVYHADFAGLGLGNCSDCTVRGCDLSYNGCNGLTMGQCEDCTVEGCTLMFNNYRHFSPGWAAGGMKCIPTNKHITIRDCEAAYNVDSPGIWFDGGNEDIRIIGNVCHHNGAGGIFFEINGWQTPQSRGGLIADNLVYANVGRGIYDSGSRRTWIVNNTVACNGAGIVCMPRENPYKLEDVRVRNNLLIRNYTTATDITRGCDLTLYMGAGGTDDNPTARTIMTNHSDYNVYADNTWTPFLRHTWNPNNTLAQWRKRFGEDLHSKERPVDFELVGTGFRLLTTKGLGVAGPLPASVGWQPADRKRVGCARTQWMMGG